MKKYAIPTVMLAVGHEIVSILALIVAAAMVIGDFINAAENKGVF